MPDSDRLFNLQDHDAVQHWVLAMCIVSERALCKNHNDDLRTKARDYA